MISFIFPYRNRDLQRLENSFNSLKEQTSGDFEVYLVDYGSDKTMAEGAEALRLNYSFIKYEYLHTSYQPWNKSKALNSIIKRLNTEYCFVADIDMVFHPNFVEEALRLQDPFRVVYFQVGFLEAGALPADLSKNFKISRRSTKEATGLSLFPVKALQEVRGFNEFYHFWGAEDTDIHVRLKNKGLDIIYYDQNLLLLHQWHPSYRIKEKKTLTKGLQIAGIVQINHQHLKQARKNKRTIVNSKLWGESMTRDELMELEAAEITDLLNNEVQVIDEFLYAYLPSMKESIVKISIKKDTFYGSLKYKMKKVLGKKVPQYYSLKSINDKILLHLISFYRDKPYYFKVSEKLDEIELAIRL